MIRWSERLLLDEEDVVMEIALGGAVYRVGGDCAQSKRAHSSTRVARLLALSAKYNYGIGTAKQLVQLGTTTPIEKMLLCPTAQVSP